MSGIRVAGRRVAVLAITALLASSGLVVDADWYRAAAQSAPGEDSSDPGSYPTSQSDPAWMDNSPPSVPSGSVEVVVPGEGMARAGDLPLLVGATGPGSPERVLVTMLDQPVAQALGAAFVAFQVVRADGGAAGGRVRVAVDYSALSRAVGGNFASRIFLRRLPSCSVTSPEAENCLVYSEVDDVNDLAAQRLSAEVAVAPDPGTVEAPGSPFDPPVYAMSSGPGGSAGDYSASPLLGSDKWQVGVHTGNFSYGYPIPLPPAVAGPVPPLALSYSSQQVDGRTASQNSQPSQVGEGWSFGAGHIERRFGGCTADGQPSTWGDLCQGKVEYFLSLDGHASELVRQSGNLWRLRDDPAWRVESFTATPSLNGSFGGDYWIVTTPDGTRYWFGWGQEPRTNKATNSAWNVPVFGDDAGEACHNPASVVASWCYQTWRWNLDRIQDTRANVATLFYRKEQNRYARNGTASLSTVYDRAGWLERLEYSKRSNAEATLAPSVVEVAVSDRCKEWTNGSACTAPDPTTATSYPDVPMELMCTSATSCPGAGQKAPTFWSTKAIARITTFMYDDIDGNATYQYEPIDRVTLSYKFPPTNETGTSPSLWLQTIARTGMRGPNDIDLPVVDLGGALLANRVDALPSQGVPLTNKYRLSSVINELGGQIVVGYTLPDPCTAADVAAAGWDVKAKSCFPQFFDPDPTFAGDEGFGGFNKYYATRVELRDLTTQSPAQITNYLYTLTTSPPSEGKAAWRHDDSLVTPLGSQSWSDFRGHARVEVRTGADVGAPISRTEYRTFRGMQGDRLAGGGPRPASVTDTEGVEFTDHHYLAGRPLETWQITPAGLYSAGTQHRYGRTETVNGPAGTTSIPHNAQYVREVNTFTQTRDAAATIPATYLTRRVDTTYDTTYGLVTSSRDYGDLATSADDACTKPVRAVNTSLWILDAVHRSEMLAASCAGTAIGRVDTYYDGAAHGTAPTIGNVTARSVWADAGTTLVTRTGYDALGRVVAVKSPRFEATGVQTTTTYAPATGYPNTTTVTAPLLPAAVSRRFLDQPGATTDVNGKTTTPAYDGLGRLTSVTRPLDVAGTPGLVFGYDISPGKSAPARAQTRTLQSGSSYLDSYGYLDGWGRTRETQAPAPNTAPTSSGGRILTATRYDERGNVAAVSAPFHQAGTPGAGFVNLAAGLIPQEQRYGYDALNRRSSVTQWAGNAERWRTTTTYYGVYTQIDSPVRGQVVHRHDAQGRTRRIEESPGPIVTKHDYSRRGDLDKITDDNNNIISYTYDWAGRRLTSSDPDQGVWTYGYDDNGNLTTATDAPVVTGTDRQQRVTTTYDELDRRKTQTSAVLAGPAGPAVSASWTYDDPTVPNSKGRLSWSTRTTDAAAYTVKTTGYDDRGRPTGTTTLLPAIPGMAASYAVTYGYDQADRIITVGYPAAGGLPAETVTTTYNSAGLPATLAGASTYVAATLYEPDGQLAGRDLGTASGTGASLVTATRRYTYDTLASRLATTRTTTAVGLGNPAVIETTEYGYDAESKLTGIRDTVNNQSECFRYDQLNRLTRAFTTGQPLSACPAAADFDQAVEPAPYNLTYAYDDIGNMLSAVDGDNQNPNTSRYHQTSGSRPHALTGVGTAAGLTDLYSVSYDNNGAMNERKLGASVLADYDFDALHRLTKAVTAGKSTSYVYDADGNRLRVIEDPNISTAGDETTTVYVAGMEIRVSPGTPTPLTTATRYYGNTALRTTSGTAADQGLWWLTNTQQNSAATAIDADSTNAGAPILRRQRYLPYGEHRPSGDTLPTDRGFLGKPEDKTGLVHLGARHYDPALGRFLSADPLLDLADPQTLNPYSYARGNPTSLSDPTGLSPVYDMGHGPTRICDAACHQNFAEGDARQREDRRLSEQAHQARVGHRLDQIAQLDSRSYHDLVMTGCPYASTSACESRMYHRINEIDLGHYTDYGFIKFVKAASGWNDLMRCADGSAASRAATAASVTPWGKLGKLRHLDNIAEGATAGRRSVDEVLSGLPRGKQGFVRTVPDERTLHSTFEELTRGGTPMTWKNYSGDVFELPDGTQIGLRGTSSSGGATIDIRIPGQDPFKIHIE